jgi:hypothetical protein
VGREVERGGRDCVDQIREQLAAVVLGLYLLLHGRSTEDSLLPSMEIRKDGFVCLASIFRGEIELCGTLREIKTFHYARGPFLLHAMKENLDNMLHVWVVDAAIPLVIRNKRQENINKVKVKTEESEKEEVSETAR